VKAERLLGLSAVVVVVLHWIGAFLPGPNSWGFHHWAFLPRPLLALVGILATALLLPPVAGRVAGLLSPLARSVDRGRRAVAPVAVILVLFGVAFWLGRQRLFLLSDGELLVRMVARGLPSLTFTVDTLATLIHLWASVLVVDVLGMNSLSASFRLVAIGAGMVWLIAMFRTVARLVPDGWSRVAIGGLLATAGITRLFYGYVETSPLLAASVALFLLAGVRLLQTGKGVGWVTASFLLAATMHVTGLLLFPAWAWLLFTWSTGDARRRGMVFGLMTLPIIVYGLLWFVLGGSARAVGDLYTPYFGKFLLPVGGLDARRAYSLLSVARVTEFLNEQFLLGPFALLAWGAILLFVPKARRPSSPAATFLAWILVPYLLLSLVFNRELGGARDWDLVATLAVPAILLVGLTLAAAPAAAADDSRRERRKSATGASPAIVVTLLGASLFHLIGFVLVDTDRERSRRHFLALFGEGAPVSRFARSYALEEVGRYDIERGNYDDAIRHFEEAVRVDPANMKAIGTLGSLYNSRGDAARALPHLERAVALRPDIGLNHYNLGAALSTAGRPVDAAHSFEEALRRDETIEPAWVGLANMALALGLPQQADSVASRGVQRFPANADLVVAAAVAREQLGRPAEAITLLEAARHVAPDNRTALFNLGRLYNDQRQFASTIPILERLTALEPRDAEAWNNLGVARLELGKLDDAGQAFMSALSADPDLVPAVANLAQVLVRQGRREEAMGVLQSFLDRRPDLAGPAGLDRMLDAVRLGAGANGAP